MGKAIVIAGPGKLQPKSKTNRMWQPPVFLQRQPKERGNKLDEEKARLKANRRHEWENGEARRKAAEQEKVNAYLGDGQPQQEAVPA